MTNSPILIGEQYQSPVSTNQIISERENVVKGESYAWDDPNVAPIEPNSNNTSLVVTN